MKCVSCGSVLQGAMKFCSCCWVPQVVDLEKEIERGEVRFIEPRKKAERGGGISGQRERWSWARSVEPGWGFLDLFDLVRIVGWVVKGILKP